MVKVRRREREKERERVERRERRGSSVTEKIRKQIT